MSFKLDIKSYYYEEPNQEYAMNLGWAIEQDDESDNTLYSNIKARLDTKNWDIMYHTEKIDFMKSAMGADSQTAELMVGYYNWKHSKKKVNDMMENFFDCDMHLVDLQYEVYSLKLDNQSIKSTSSKSSNKKNNNDDNFSGGFFAGRLWG